MSLSNEQYAKINRIYEDRRAKSLKDLEIKKSLVYIKSPRLKEINDTIASLSSEAVRKLLDGDRNASDKLKQEVYLLSNEREDILKALGLGTDYLKPMYKCKICKDTGWVNNSKCECLIREECKLLFSSSNIDASSLEDSFDKFDFSFYSDKVDISRGKSPLDNAKEAYAKSIDFVENFDKEFKNLLFRGSVGLGKTFLVNCIAKEVMKKNHSVLYFSAPNFFDIIAEYKYTNEAEKKKNKELINEVDLLIIDDLGSEVMTVNTVPFLFEYINERFINKKPIIISTNLEWDKIKNIYLDRVFSRLLANYDVLYLLGDDIRRIKKLER